MNAWVLAGPTATGKSAAAHAIALELDAVVLCADAMTVYRGMDIGTAKPDAAMRERVPYFGLDVVDPDQSFSAGAFVEVARTAARAAMQLARPLIVAGGSGLYLSAIMRGLDECVPSDPARRAYWEGVYREQGLEALQLALRERSLDAYRALADPKNPRRLIRALERFESGAPARTSWKAGSSLRPICGLIMDSGALKSRIAARARAMINAGLLDEAAHIRARWPTLSSTACKAIGYEEAFAVLDGALNETQAVQRIVARTWQLARRQMTWFRRQLPVSWLHVEDQMTPSEVAARVRRQWEQDGPSPLHL